jgi:hypothetical protein
MTDGPTISTSERAAPARTQAAPGRLRQAAGRIDWIMVGGLVLLGLFLLPALHGAFRGDDTWNSVTRGQLELSGTSLPGAIGETFDHYVSSAGRPNLLAPIQGTLTVWLFDGEFAYHAYLVALTLVAAGLFYALLRELGVPRWGGLLVLTLLAGAIQFRSYHDGMLGYAGTIQIVLAFLFASLLFFVRGLRRDDKRLLVLSFFLFLPCPLLYEGTYTLVALYAGVALLERRGWAAVRACLPFLALGATFVVASYFLRKIAPEVVPGYEVGGSPMAALRTYFVQMFAPLPASSLIFGADYGAFIGLGGDPTKPELLAAFWRAAAVFAVVALVALHLTGKDGSRLPTRESVSGMAVIGVLLWTTSTLIISFAPKYQTELIPGRGHLPVVVQVFGWSLVAAAALFALLRAAVARSRPAVLSVTFGAAGLLALGAGMVGFTNMRVIAAEQPIRETRTLLDEGARAGAFASIPTDGSLVFSDRDLAWPTGKWTQFPGALESDLRHEAGRRFDARQVSPPLVFDCPPSGTKPPSDCEPLAKQSAWVRVRAHPGGGSVIVASPLSSARKPFEATATHLRVYARGSDSTPPVVIAETAAGRRWSSNGLRWQRVDGGSGWAIYEATLPRGQALRANTIDDANGKVDFTALGSPAQIVRIYGTSQLLP